MSERSLADLHDVPNPAPVTRPPVPAPGRPAPAATVLALGQATDPLFVRPRSGPGHPRFRVAGAGTPVSGALGAALLATAALLLAPGQARADAECGAAPSGGGAITCSATAYANGIEYANTAPLHGNDAYTVDIPGSSTATTTISVKAAPPGSGIGTQGVAVRLDKGWGSGGNLPRGALTVNIGGETGGTPHVVNIRQGGATWVVQGHQDNGIHIANGGIGSSTTLNVRRGVTIGTQGTPMERAGINLWLDVSPLTTGGAWHAQGAGGVALDNAAPIFARLAGIKVHRASGGTLQATTIVNSGDISAGVGNPSDTSAEVDQPHGINLIAAGSQALTTHTGNAKITNTGAITVSGAYAGIRMSYNLYGAAEIDNAGDVDAAMGRGIQLDYSVNGSGAVTLTNSGAIGAATYGIRIRKASGSGAVAFTNSGAVTVTGDAAPGVGHALYLLEEAGVSAGAVTITNSGVLRSKNHAIFASMALTATNADGLTLTNSAAVTSEDGDGIRIQRHNAGAVTVMNRAAVAGRGHGVYIDKEGTAGAVSVTHSAGAVTSGTRSGIRAGNAFGNAEDVTIRVTGGSVASSGRNAMNHPAHAVTLRQMGTGDAVFELASGATLTSMHNAGVFATLGAGNNAAGQIRITQAGTISGRTGVLAEVPRESAMGETRMAADQPLIGVAWTGTFARDAAKTAADDTGRFTAATAADVLSFDREAAAVKALEEAGTVRYGGAAGIEAHALSWRDVVAAVAEGDDPDPDATMTNTEQMNLLSTTHVASRRTAILAQLRAALANEEIEVAAAVLTAIDSTATSVSDLSDAEIVEYLDDDDAPTRALLRNVLAQGLSEKEKAVLRAVATGDGAGLATALDDADAGFSNAYKTAVRALLDRYNVGDVRVAMTGGSIDSRGDGIRAWYATPHANNGGISVTVAAGTTVTGGMAGVHVANAGTGLMLARKYTYGYAPDDTADELVAVMHGEGADAAALRNQLVTVAGTVTGGTDAGVRLSGGGAVIVMEGGRVHAGASGVGIGADGPALVYVDGEVKGGAGGAAAVHLSGGGSVTVGPNGRVQANGAARAIRGGGTAATMVALTLVTERLVPYREDVNAQVDGSLAGVDEARLREYRDGVPTGYSQELRITADGMLDTSKFPSRPEEQFDCAAADGRCRITQGETITGRTGVYAAVPRASAEGETRAAADQPLIGVTWTGTFSHAEGSNDRGRFEAASARDAPSFDRESAAGKAEGALEGSVRYGGPAGIEAHALSWRDVAAEVAKGDDPNPDLDLDETMTNTEQMNLLSEAHADSERAAILAQFKAALGNDEIEVAPAVITAIGSTATTAADLTDAEIVTYLGTDDAVTRALLRNVLAQGLSDAEKEVLRAVATGDSAGLTTALDDADAGFSDAYETAVRALLERYNVGDIRVAVNEGSITATRGDGIRAYYATPHDLNGGISVTVAAGARVTGAMAGVYVANAGPGLRLARKYTPGYSEEDRNRADEVVAVMHGEGADAVALRNQLVTVAGTVTGGRDAAVRLSGGGAVIVMEGGKVHAGDAGVGILVNDPGPAVVHVDGEVKGRAGGAAAVHLTGGGSVIIGLNGRVEASGATRAIRGGGDAATMVALTLVTDGIITHREDAEAAYARVEGSIEDIENVRLREDRDGVPTGYSLTLTVDDEGLLDTSKLPSRPEPPSSSCPEAADGRCIITQAGTISGRTGVYAAVPRASAEGETRAASAQPLIDVTWTGTFSHAEGSNDRGRFEAATARDVLSFDREASAGKAEGALEGPVRYGGPAGIEAHALSWREVVAEVAKGDDPGEIADAAAQTALVPTGATAGDNAYVAQFKAALGNEEIEVASAVFEALKTGATSLADLEDADIVTYLQTDDALTRALLRNVLAQGLSDDEKAVLRAAATDTGVDAALDDADAGFPAAYKTAVRALLERYNVGDIRIAMTGGSIDSRGDGIRAYYATPHDLNGGISVTVASGATVTGAMAGVYVANAGPGLMLARKYTLGYSEGDAPDEVVAVMHGEGEDAVPLLDQLVTVAGKVTGGTDAAVHLNGGGAVLVMEGGKVHAGSSGVAIKVNDPGPALVYIDGEVKGKVPAEGEAPAPAAVHLTGGGSVIVGLNGKVEANGAARAIRGGGTAATGVDLVVATAGMVVHREDAEEAVNARVEGSLEDVGNVRFREHRNGEFTGYGPTLPVGDNDMLDPSGLDPRPNPTDDPTDPTDDPTDPVAPPPPFSCPEAGDRRCRLYEALPSMLLAMNGLPSYAERTSAVRDGNGGWASVEAARGEWQAKKATMGGKLAYDHRRSAVRAGVDFLAGESARVGVSVHALRGKAEMGGVGEVELDGMGGGLSATWLVGGLYVDAQAAVTLYDVDVESNMFGKMPKKDVYGAGYGLGVDVGRRMSVGGMFVTPRAGVGWSKVELDDFTDMERYGGPRAEVSVEDAVSVKGRLGVMLEMEVGSGGTSGQVFGSLDVEGEFSDETEVKVGGQMLKTQVRPTAVRLGLGGEFAVDEDVVVRGTGGFRTSGSGTSGYGGGLELRVRF